MKITEDIIIFWDLTPCCLVTFGNLVPPHWTIWSHISVNLNPISTAAKCYVVNKQTRIEQSVELKQFLGMYNIFLLISYTMPVILESIIFTFHTLSSKPLTAEFRVRSESNPIEELRQENGNRTSFRLTSVSPVSNTSHLSRCHSFVHLSQALYNLRH
jgi:hypothetical protein